MGTLHRQLVKRSSSVSIEGLATEIRDLIGHLALLFGRLYEAHTANVFGERIEKITNSLFDLWCSESLIPTRTDAETRISGIAGASRAPQREASAFFRAALSCPEEDALTLADRAISVLSGSSTEALEAVLEDAYRLHTQRFLHSDCSCLPC